MANSCVPSVLSSINSINNENPIDKLCSCPLNHSNTESSSELQYSQTQQEQNLDYAKFKKILQRPSSKSGNNLFDHLVAIIKRIIDERPSNVIDYFEQFSRTVRANKLNGLDSNEEPQFFEIAKSVIEFMKTSYSQDPISYIEEFEELAESKMTIYQSSDSIHQAQIERSSLNYSYENVLQTHHYFALCGLGFDIDEVFQLALSVQKVQHQRNVENARFWGRIFGLKGSYYVVEAVLTRTEVQNRLQNMKARILDEMKSFISEKARTRTPCLSDELIPGSKWQNSPKEDLDKMQYPTAPIPQLQFEKIFDGPEEAVGSGLNSKTYFVTTSLSREWQELPNIAPKHIKASKTIKKYFTGDLNVSLEPLFPGSEKHYLRAMIARITAGTSIAPKGLYRRMTRKERKLVEESYEIEDEEVFETDEEEDPGNDALITQNHDYKQLSLEELTLPSSWVHFRPNILNQGRIIHLNEELAIKDLEKRAISRMKGYDFVWDDLGEHEFEEEDFEEENQEEENIPSEIGPQLFSSCNEDRNNEGIPSWTFRYSSVYRKLNQMIIVRSNLWPGAYSIAFENFSNCIYLGWGSKYVSRCTSLQPLPVIQDVDFGDIAKEENDPTVEMEEKWRAHHVKKSLNSNYNEEMSDMSVEVDFDDDEDED